MTPSVGRRQFLEVAGATLFGGALAGCSFGTLESKSRSSPSPVLQLPRLRVGGDRITNITVCTRPFRAQGPRLDVERIQGKTVVHNYGHGGSGWSLSWGSSAIAAENAMASGERQVGVIGCGAMGLTSALLLQRAGARVTIYAKELPPNVRSCAEPLSSKHRVKRKLAGRVLEVCDVVLILPRPCRDSLPV